VNVATTGELQTAVANLTSGQTIVVADGTYDLTQTLVLRGGLTGVTIRGASGDRDRVIIRGRGMSNPSYGNVPHVFLIQDVDDVLLADMTLRDAYFHNIQIQGENGAHGIRMYRLRLIDAGEQQVKGSSGGPPGPYADDGEVACSIIEYSDRARSDYTNGVDVLAGAGWVIRDNLFRNIRAPVGQLAGPAVLMWRNCLDTIVERNTFVECDRGVALGLASPDPGNARDGETTYDHQGGIVRNNFFHRAPGAATGDVGITVNYARDYAIHHNTVVLNGTFAWAIEYRFAVSDGALAYNLTDGQILQRNGAGGTLTGNVIDAQPSWFVDEANADLHLASSATAAIDRAAPLTEVTDDIDGETRPIGSATDVGADEQGCSLPPDPIVAVMATRDQDDVVLTWQSQSVPAYNVWYVDAKGLIDRARRGDSVAFGVTACSDPASTTATTCRDPGAVIRWSPAGLHYQVRAACPGIDEGP